MLTVSNVLARAIMVMYPLAIDASTSGLNSLNIHQFFADTGDNIQVSCYPSSGLEHCAGPVVAAKFGF